MIEEVADLRIQPDQQQAFEVAIHKGVTTVIAKAKGFCGYSVSRSIETPTRYLLRIQWETVEDHTVGFRESPLFAQWRAIVSPFFTAPPAVEHFVLTDKPV